MPSNSGWPFLLSMIFFVLGFAMVFSMWHVAVLSVIIILLFLGYRTLEKDDGYYITVKELEQTERRLRGEQQ